MSFFGRVFPNAATTTALIDRVVHHAEIITIEGESYRRRIAEARRKSHHAHRPPDRHRPSVALLRDRRVAPITITETSDHDGAE